MRKSSSKGVSKVFSRRITESCSNGNIIVRIMNLSNCQLSVTKRK